MRTFTVQLCCALLLVAWTSTAERRQARVLSPASHIQVLKTHGEKRSSSGDAASDEYSLPAKTRLSENRQESDLPEHPADDTHTTSKRTTRSRRTRRTLSTIVATLPVQSDDRDVHTTVPADHSEEGRAENSSSWHAHIHVDQLFNTSSELSEIAYSETKYFLDKIFNKYGTSSSMTLPDLTRLIQNLGLSAEDGGPDAEDGSDVTSGKSRRRKKSVTHVHSNHSDCHFITDLLWAFHFDSLTTLDTSHFLLLCPALIDQLDNGDCHRHQRHHHHHHQDNHLDTDSDHDTVALDPVSVGIASIPAHAWLYSFVAVLIISLVGLLGVAVIPLMRKLFYKSLLQFLISLAVGALSGDALLHLLPHALVEEEENHGAKEGHSSDSVWKGLVALVALVFFFVLERVLHVVTSQRAKRRQQKKIGSNISGLANDNGTSMMSPLVLTILPGGIASSNEISVTEKGIISDKDNIHDSYVSATADDAQHSNHNHGDPGGHGHGHGHAHLSEMPDSVAAVAWMVILGDGIHNFSDGLAIGAAFANSITGGFSTSVAVFCHELPHEIGDFAVLLSSGMTVKQGLTYNVLSSALCFLGMVAGMLLGQVKSASIWIFAAVGGMFLYISLADMLPQLSTAGNQSGKAAFKNLLVQCLGIVLGAAIMLTIAVFEEDLKNMLD